MFFSLPSQPMRVSARSWLPWLRNILLTWEHRS